METASSIDKKRPDRRGVLCSVGGEMPIPVCTNIFTNHLLILITLTNKLFCENNYNLKMMNR